MSRTMSSWVISAFASSPALRPSRSTVTRSAQRFTSASRCEMYRTDTPAAFSAVDDLVEPLGLASASGWTSARP